MDAAQHRTPARIDGRCTLPSCAQTDRPRTPVPPTAAARLLSTASWRSAVDANRVMSCRAPGYRARREYRGPHRWEIDRRHGERQRILGAGHGPPRRRVRGARRVVFMHGLARSGAPAASGVRTVDGAPGNGGHFGGAPHMAAGAMAASVRRPLPHPAAEVGRMPVNRVRCASRHLRHRNGPGCSHCYWVSASSGWKTSWTQRMGRRAEQPTAPSSAAGRVRPADAPVRLPEVTGAR